MPDNKPILAIETSQALCSTCIYFSETKYFETNFLLKNAHAEKLFQSIDSVLKLSNIKIDEIGSIAISSGPGSFTGLRIGMSAAKGLCFGSSIPIIPVPTFEAMAYQISHYLNDGVEFTIANKVNIEEIYFAKFKKTSSGYVFIESLKVLNHEEVKDKIHNTLIFGNALLDSGNNLGSTSGNRNIFSPNSKYIAEWGKSFGKILNDYEFLEPEYVKNFVIKEKKNV